MKPFLVVILVIGLGGLVFSGYLSYRELFSAASVARCTPVGEPGSALGAPPCIYGFFMYLVIVVMAVLALARRAAKE